MSGQKISSFEERFSELASQYPGSDSEKAKLIGVSRQTISAWRTGVRSPKQPMIIHIASIFKVSVEWLMGFDVPMQENDCDIFQYPGVLPVTIHRVPILGGAACGEPLYAPGDGTEYATTDGDISCDFALVAHGDSMTGDRIHDGDIVFFKKQDDVEDGQIAAVSIDDGVSIKRVKRLRAPDGSVLFTQLLSSNPTYNSIDIGGQNETRVVHILGKAVAFKGKLNQ